MEPIRGAWSLHPKRLEAVIGPPAIKRCASLTAQRLGLSSKNTLVSHLHEPSMDDAVPQQLLPAKASLSVSKHLASMTHTCFTFRVEFTTVSAKEPPRISFFHRVGIRATCGSFFTGYGSIEQNVTCQISRLFLSSFTTQVIFSNQTLMTCFRHVSWHLQKFVLRISDARTLNGVSLPAPVWAGGLPLLGKFEPETL